MVSFLPTFQVLFMSSVLCLNILIFPSLLYRCKRFECGRSLDVSDLILNMIPLWRMDTLAWQPLHRRNISSALIYCVCISTDETGRASPFVPLPLISAVKSPGVQCDPHRHPTGRPAQLPLSPSCFIATVYMTSLGKAPPPQSVGQYRAI